MKQSPFKFLDSYTKDDRNIFFGREREIEELYQKVFESKIMLVYGVSGTGKSSLIHCGLANKFQDADWLPINIRRGGDMVKSMDYAIQQATITPIEREIKTPNQFKKAVRSLYLDHYKPIFFIFDQFEELFIFGNKEEKREFIQVIKALSESDLQCRFMFVLRKEYLADVTEFEKVIPTFMDNRVNIELMTLAKAKQVIEGPCKVAGIEVEEGFPDEMLEKLSPESTEVELTYLQVYLDKVYRTASTPVIAIPTSREKQSKRSHSDEEKIASQSTLAMTFRKDILKQLGEVKDLLGSFLDEQIELLPDPDSALAVLKSFVSVKGTKRQMSLEEVQDYAKTLGKPISETALQELLQTLIQLRILRDKDQKNRYELRHDALATKIYEKITLVEKELLEIRDLIENAYSSWEKRGVLLSEDDLKYIAPYEEKLYLNDDLHLLIAKSKSKINQIKRIKRNWTAAAIALVLISTTLLGITSYQKQKRAELQTRIEKSIQLGNSSLKFVDEDPSLAYLLAEKAYLIHPTFESKRALINSYLKAPFCRTLLGDFYVTANSGSFILSADNTENLLRLYNYKGDLLFSYNKFSSQILANSLKFLKNEEYVSAISIPDSNLVILDMNGKEVFKKNIDDTFFTFDAQYFLQIIETDHVVYVDNKKFQKYEISGELIDEVIHKNKVKAYKVLPAHNECIVLYYNGSVEIKQLDSFKTILHHKIKLETESNYKVISLNNCNQFQFVSSNHFILWNRQNNSVIEKNIPSNKRIVNTFPMKNSFAHIIKQNETAYITIYDMNGNTINRFYSNDVDPNIFCTDDYYLITDKSYKTIQLNDHGKILKKFEGQIIHELDGIMVLKDNREPNHNKYRIICLIRGVLYEGYHHNDIFLVKNNLLSDGQFLYDFKHNRLKIGNYVLNVKDNFFIDNKTYRNESFGFAEDGIINLWNLDYYLGSIENFSFGNNPKARRKSLAFSKSNGYIISQHNDSLVLFNDKGGKLKSIYFYPPYGYNANDIKFSNNDNFFSIISDNSSDKESIYYDINIFSLPDLKKRFEKKFEGPANIEFFPNDDTIVLYNRGNLKFYDKNLNLCKIKPIPNLIQMNYSNQNPQINYPFISGVTTNNEKYHRLLVPDKNSEFIVHNFIKDTTLRINVSNEVNYAINYADSATYSTLYRKYYDNQRNQTFKWNGFKKTLNLKTLNSNDIIEVSGKLDRIQDIHLKNNLIFFSTFSTSTVFSQFQYYSAGYNVQNMNYMNVCKLYNNSQKTRYFAYDTDNGYRILNSSFIEMNNNLYNYDFRVILSLKDEFINPETSNDDKYLLLYSKDENRYKKIPLLPEEIIKRVRKDREFGVIRDFSEQEKNEYRLN